MPIYLHEHLTPKAEIGIWQVNESETWFKERLPLAPEEQARLEKIKGRRRVEWLAARYLVHVMSGRKERGIFIKDKYGKPFLDKSDYLISISHSGELAAAIAAPRPVGIDIQRLVAKIGRIAHRFMSPQEMASLPPEGDHRVEAMHVFWGAKEALYKAYGRRALDFREHMQIPPFEYKRAGGQFVATLHTKDHNEEYDFFYRLVGSFMLVYGWLKTTS